MSGVHNVFVEIGMSHQFQSWEIHMNWESGAESGTALSGTGTPSWPGLLAAPAPRPSASCSGVSCGGALDLSKEIEGASI